MSQLRISQYFQAICYLLGIVKNEVGYNFSGMANFVLNQLSYNEELEVQRY